MKKMNKEKLSLMVLCFCTVIFAYAGNSKSESDAKDFRTIPGHEDFNGYPVADGSSAEAVAAFVRKQCPNMRSTQAGLALGHSSTSLAAYHYTFDQTFNGIPVFAASITVNVSMQNVAFAIFDDSYDMSKWNVNTTAFDYKNTSAYQTYIRQFFADATTEEAKPMIAFDEKNNAAEFCYSVTIRDAAHQMREALVGRDRIIYDRDRNMYFAAPDSTVTGMVFNPDPLTTAHQVWGGPSTPWDNHNDSDIVQLNAQRQSVTFKANYDQGTGIFSLNNQYVQLNSNTTPATSMTPVFNYTRSHSEFEDVMAFYHLNMVRSRMHALGFHCADTLVTVDPHGTDQDNSWFSAPSYLTFGTGGVPDAQDADVVVHEYTHFLSWNANGTNNSGSTGERSALDEGICDYDAASYSKSIDTFFSGWVYNFDGHNEFWPGRVVNDFTIYPAQPSAGVSGIYRLCETWSSALMSIWDDLGRNVTDSLAFEALYSYGHSTTLPQAAQLMIYADCMLFNGAHYARLQHDFSLHGITYGLHFLPCGVYAGLDDIKNGTDAIRLASNPYGFKVLATQNGMNLNIDLYNIAGQKLAAYGHNTGEIKPELPNGIYIVDVSTQGMHKAFKWVRAQ